MIPFSEKNGVTDEMFIAYVTNLFASDCSLPHTSSRISPLTFLDYVSRSGIMTLNINALYCNVNELWSKFIGMDIATLRKTQGNFSMDIVDVPGRGWTKLIEMLDRFIRVQDIENYHYKQHYISHLCYINKHNGRYDDLEHRNNFLLFNEIISPVLYPTILTPSTNEFDHVMSVTDARFPVAVNMAVKRALEFIQDHSKVKKGKDKFDMTRIIAGINLVKGELSALTQKLKSKSQDGWEIHYSHTLTQANFILFDINQCEDLDGLRKSGAKCIDIFEKLDALKRAFDKKQFSGDADHARDRMLDVYSFIKQCLESYELNEDGIPIKRKSKSWWK